MVVVLLSFLELDSCRQIVNEQVISKVISYQSFVIVTLLFSDISSAQGSASGKTDTFIFNIGIEVFYGHLVATVSLPSMAEETLKRDLACLLGEDRHRDVIGGAVDGVFMTSDLSAKSFLLCERARSWQAHHLIFGNVPGYTVRTPATFTSSVDSGVLAHFHIQSLVVVEFSGH